MSQLQPQADSMDVCKSPSIPQELFGCEYPFVSVTPCFAGEVEGTICGYFPWIAHGEGDSSVTLHVFVPSKTDSHVVSRDGSCLHVSETFVRLVPPSIFPHTRQPTILSVRLENYSLGFPELTY